MTTKQKLVLESLEAREVPTVFGNPWQAATSLTMSLAPDGVQYSNQTWGSGTFSSSLYSELNGSMAQGVWQEELLKAVYAWTSQANINVGHRSLPTHRVAAPARA